MAANEAWDGQSTNKHWWIRTFGLYKDRLFIAFRNGDCAHYRMPLLRAQWHVRQLKFNPHPGHYVNFEIGRFHGVNEPYDKIADPTSEITQGGNATTCELRSIIPYEQMNGYSERKTGIQSYYRGFRCIENNPEIRFTAVNTGATMSWALFVMTTFPRGEYDTCTNFVNEVLLQWDSLTGSIVANSWTQPNSVWIYFAFNNAADDVTVSSVFV